MSGDWRDPREVVIVGLVCGCVTWTQAPATGNMIVSPCRQCGELGTYTRWIRKEPGWFWQDDNADNNYSVKLDQDSE